MAVPSKVSAFTQRYIDIKKNQGFTLKRGDRCRLGSGKCHFPCLAVGKPRAWRAPCLQPVLELVCPAAILGPGSLL